MCMLCVHESVYMCENNFDVGTLCHILILVSGVCVVGCGRLCWKRWVGGRRRRHGKGAGCGGRLVGKHAAAVLNCAPVSVCVCVCVCGGGGGGGGGLTMQHSKYITRRYHLASLPPVTVGHRPGGRHPT